MWRGTSVRFMLKVMLGLKILKLSSGIGLFHTCSVARVWWFSNDTIAIFISISRVNRQLFQSSTNLVVGRGFFSLGAPGMNQLRYSVPYCQIVYSVYVRWFFGCDACCFSITSALLYLVREPPTKTYTSFSTRLAIYPPLHARPPIRHPISSSAETVFL